MNFKSVYLALGLVLLTFGAAAQQITSPTSGYKILSFNTAGASGNAADITEDILTNCNFVMPIGVMPNIGDKFIVTLGGKFSADANSKSARVRFGTTNAGVPVMVTVSGTTATMTSWAFTMVFQKTALNAQNVWILSNTGSTASFNGTSVSTGAFSEALLNNFTVTGQNTISATANTVTCQMMETAYSPVQ